MSRKCEQNRFGLRFVRSNAVRTFPFLRVVGLAVVFLIGLITLPLSAQQRYCVGACDQYGHPVYDQPGEIDFGNDYRYPPEYEGEQRVSPNPPTIGEPRYVPPGFYDPPRRPRYSGERRYRRPHYRQKRHVRRYKRRHRRVHRRSRQRSYVGRTKFCRVQKEERQRNGRWVWVKVKRCIWVRNDLLHRYRDY